MELHTKALCYTYQTIVPTMRTPNTTTKLTAIKTLVLPPPHLKLPFSLQSVTSSDASEIKRMYVCDYLVYGFIFMYISISYQLNILISF